ncbi:MAG: hypothetical protein GY696_01910 [Gammaproteobacteria bacterium]|nr:hypothetical protein [Gammaproteobacteria bacterium]
MEIRGESCQILASTTQRQERGQDHRRDEPGASCKTRSHQQGEPGASSEPEVSCETRSHQRGEPGASCMARSCQTGRELVMKDLEGGGPPPKVR